MSIRNIQIASVLEEITNSYFAAGINPTINQVLNQMSNFFSQYPAGQAMGIPPNLIASGGTARAEDLNLIFAHIAMNIELLYQACMEQTTQNIGLTQTLASALNRLSTRQQSLTTKISDYMLSAYNSNSYYYSLSDNFGDTSQTDLVLTSAFVDTSNNSVVIPTISSLSKVVDPSQLGSPSYSATINGNSVSLDVVSPLSFSTNGLSNTVWEIQVKTQTPAEVILSTTIPINGGQTITLSELDFTPYGVTPPQMYAQVALAPQQVVSATYTNFGGDVQTSLRLMKFINNTPVNVNSIRFFLRKTEADYVSNKNGTTEYVYVFGASNLVMVENVYDDQATFVSGPLSVNTDLSSEVIIDAVSLAVNEQLPAATDIEYSIAQDPGNATQLSDFDWQPITPIDQESNSPNTVIQFNGSIANVVYIKNTPGPNDLQLIPLDNINNNLALQNPTPTIIPGTDTYTLANFNGTPLLNSISLEEGINSTKIYYINYGDLVNYTTNDPNEDTETSHCADIQAWGNVIAQQASLPNVNLIYGEIDKGNGFFYGGDIGENGVSVMVETYLYLTDSIEPIVDYLQKADAAAQTWDVRAYLNGSVVGWLPGRNSNQTDTPVDSLLIPWNFNPGPNYINILINIPPITTVDSSVSPYSGTLQLMQNHNLYSFGTVKLANWQYVDFFDLQYNTVGTPTTFTIYNGQLISRRQPTTNYRLSYNEASGSVSESIRLRADLSRDPSNPYVTPQLNTYQVRFSYGNNN